MKTCGDCIHFYVCDIQLLRKIEKIGVDLCYNFKDESRLIELPCSIGDTVYAVIYNNIFEAKVVCIRPFVFKNYIEYRGNVIITRKDPFYSDGRLMEQELFIIFGKDTFLTREEAEKKLEELNV